VSQSYEEKTLGFLRKEKEDEERGGTHMIDSKLLVLVSSRAWITARVNLEFLARVAAFWAFFSAGSFERSLITNGQPSNLPCRTVRNRRQKKGDSNNMGEPQVPQFLGGLHQEAKSARITKPLKNETQIQGHDRGLTEPLRESSKVKMVISAEIQVNQIGEKHCERDKLISIHQMR